MQTTKARFLFLVALWAMLGIPTLCEAGSDTPPVRIALPGLERPISPTRASMFNCTMGLYLRSRLQEISSIALVSDNRMASIMEELISPAHDTDLRDLLGAFRAFQPVDACVYYDLTGTVVRVIVQTPERLVNETFVLNTNTMTLAQGVSNAVRIIGGALSLAPRDMAVLTEERWSNPADFAAYYECQAWPVPVVTPTYKGSEYGDIRLRHLFEQWNKNKENPFFDEQVLKNAIELAVSTRKIDFFKVDWVWMAKESLKGILGSSCESAAYPYVRSRPGEYQDLLLDLCEPLSMEAGIPLSLDGLAAASDEMTIGGTKLDSSIAPETKKPVSFDKRLGALRVLGFVGKPKALAVLQETAGHKDTRVREAAAFGLRVFPEGKGLPRLRKMAGDPEKTVAWAAAFELWMAGEPTPNLLPLARTFAASNSVHRADAARALCALGVETDLPLIRSLWNRPPPDLRCELLRTRIRLKDVKDPEWTALLQDPDEAVLLEALAQPLNPQSNPDLFAEMKRLANDPYGPVSRAARHALLPLRPATPLERAGFDLELEHPYFRKKALEWLAQTNTPAALALIEAACTNRDSHTRATALGLLTERAPERARPLVLAALGDPHRWVRFQASVLAGRVADRTTVGPLEERLCGVHEPAEHLFLEEALARAKGTPPPAPPEAARSIAGPRNLAWNTSPGLQSDTSPFDAYYSMKVQADAGMRKAHKAGKIIFGRATPIGSPGPIVLNATARDEFWLELEEELTPDNLVILDGLVFGEETMGMSADTLWEDGWEVFCMEAGIPSDRVNGRLESLTPSELRAWREWAIARHVEGFNLLHDFVKLKYGKLRPGLQICTFLPADALPHPGSPDAIQSWKFDMGGVYDYKGDNRMACYNLVRRYKTLWPDRPVLWLSLGIGGYEMNPVRHTQKVPQAPMLDRYDRAYSDSLTAWMAGADTGWFSTWMFVKPDFKRQGMAKLRGIQVWVEDLGPNTRALEKAIAWSFSGVEKIEEEKLSPAAPEAPDLKAVENSIPEKDLISDPFVEQQEAEQKENISAEVKERRDRFRDGFLFYQRYVYDCARIFASLPRLNTRPSALAVRGGVDVWTQPGAYPLVPAQTLLNEYDFLCDVNTLCKLDLAPYRMIVVHRPEALRDATIERLSRWLKETPGLLVVHLDLPSENDAEAGTVQDHDGRLLNDWPWEADISRKAAPATTLKKAALTGTNGPFDVAQLTVTTTWTLSGARAQPLVRRGEDCLLALWRNPGEYRGAVLFDGVQDASVEYLDALRGIINSLHQEAGIGLELKGPANAEILDMKPIHAAAASMYHRSVRGDIQMAGMEVMMGEPDPVVSGKTASKAALVGREFIGRFVEASSNLTVISDVPFTSARLDGDNLVLESAGVMRAASRSGRVSVSTGNAKPLPETTNTVSWLLYSSDEGIARVPQGTAGRVMTYIRSRTPVTLSYTPSPVYNEAGVANGR